MMTAITSTVRLQLTVPKRAITIGNAKALTIIPVVKKYAHSLDGLL